MPGEEDVAWDVADVDYKSEANREKDYESVACIAGMHIRSSLFANTLRLTSVYSRDAEECVSATGKWA